MPKSKVDTIAAATTLTGSMATVGVALDTKSAARCTLRFGVVRGTGGTLVEVEVQGSLLDSGDTDWCSAEGAVDTTAALSSGVVAAAAGTFRRTYATTGAYSCTIDCAGFRRLRVQARETGSPSPFGTLAITAVKVGS